MVLSITSVVGILAVPEQANAGFISSITCIIAPASCSLAIAQSLLPSLFAELGNMYMWVMSLLLSFAGTLLNISIVLTMNMKVIYDSTPAIEQLWILIRNISSIFIIFGLLLVSIQTILDVGKNGVGNMVKNIIIAGMLINFSLFFTKTLIDASNLISLSIYRSIAPTSQNVNITKDDLSTIVSKTFDSGGISSVFMSSLKIQTIYDPAGKIQQDGTKSFMNIIIASVVGGTIMFIAALSFFAASIAFIIRIVVLLLLLSSSPIYFVGMIFPEVESKISKKWEGWLISELIFMPAYLFLMYFAMSFISSNNEGFFALLDKNRGGVDSNINFSLISLLLQYSIALVLINIPLIVAVQMGGTGAKWGETAKNWAGGKIKGVAGRQTLGRLGGALGSGFDSMAAKVDGGTKKYLKFGASVLRKTNISQGIRGKLTEMEKGKYGSKYSNEDIDKEDKDRARVIVGIQRSQKQQEAIDQVLAGGAAPTPAMVDHLGKVVGGMTNKEIEKLKYKTLNDPNFISHLSSSQFDKLIESDNINDKEKQDLKDTRKATFDSMLSAGTTLTVNAIKDKVKLLSGKDLSKLDSSIFRNTDVVNSLTPGQLKEMTDMDAGIRADIGNHIRSLARNTHKARGYIEDNINQWS